LGRSIGEHIRQGPKAQAGLAGDREAACRQQRADLMDRASDGGAVDSIEHGGSVVWQLEAQVDQGGQDSIGEDEPVVGAGASGALPRVPAAGEQGALLGGGPRGGELGNQLAQMLPGQPGEDRQDERGPHGPMVA
jgi:hypothetical protein